MKIKLRGLVIEKKIFLRTVLLLVKFTQICHVNNIKAQLGQYGVASYKSHFIWFRILPLLIGAIMLQLLWPLIGSGPVFREAALNSTMNCLNTFYKNLFLISNNDRFNEMVSASRALLTSSKLRYSLIRE